MEVKSAGALLEVLLAQSCCTWFSVGPPPVLFQGLLQFISAELARSSQSSSPYIIRTLSKDSSKMTEPLIL